jgi:hypothetical protein
LHRKHLLNHQLFRHSALSLSTCSSAAVLP